MELPDKTQHLEQIVEDLNHIFSHAMADKNWAVALKSRELLLKVLNIDSAHKAHAGLKPLSEWSDEEIHAFIAQAEQ